MSSMLPLLWLRLGPLHIPVPHPGRLDAHDLHHVALGVGVDIEGEAVVSAFELRTGPPTLGIALLCLAAVALGLLRCPRRLRATWREAAGCHNTYGLNVDDRRALQRLPADELRTRLGLKPQRHHALSCRGRGVF